MKTETVVKRDLLWSASVCLQIEKGPFIVRRAQKSHSCYYCSPGSTTPGLSVGLKTGLFDVNFHAKTFPRNAFFQVSDLTAQTRMSSGIWWAATSSSHSVTVNNQTYSSKAKSYFDRACVSGESAKDKKQIILRKYKWLMWLECDQPAAVIRNQQKDFFLHLEIRKGRVRRGARGWRVL